MENEIVLDGRELISGATAGIQAALTMIEEARGKGENSRSLSIAITELETGLMWLNRHYYTGK